VASLAAMKRAAALVLALALCAAPVLAAAPVPIAGSVVSLTPPDGFSPAKDFAGLQGHSASVTVADMDGTFAEITAVMTTDKAPVEGLKITRREDLTGLPFKAALFTATQVVAGKTADKWLLVAERPGGVSLINATSIHGAGNLTDAGAHALMRSVRLSPVANADPFSGLGFTVTAPSFLAHRQAVAGMGVAMTAGIPSDDNAGQAALFVGQVFQQPVAFKDHVAAFAYAISNMKALTLNPSGAPTPLKIGELDALQAAMTGTDAAGQPVEAIATLVFGPASAYLILGTAAPAAFSAMQPGFKASTASFRLK
jgi:hypothetical protein